MRMVLRGTPLLTGQKLYYIHNNPVRRGIVEKPEDNLYSSAINYTGLRNGLEIDFLSQRSFHSKALCDGMRPCGT